jgi:excinuclease ABC subunit A
LTVITGVSGSGKSSLAFDTIYAEGQRRYVESLSAYARQFLERMEKPAVDEIDGIAPAIAIRQKNTTRNPRSTVATSTECYDFLRLLWARVAAPFAPTAARRVQRDSVDQVARGCSRSPPDRAGTRCFPSAEHIRTRKLRDHLFELRKKGFNRLFQAGRISNSPRRNRCWISIFEARLHPGGPHRHRVPNAPAHGRYRRNLLSRSRRSRLRKRAPASRLQPSASTRKFQCKTCGTEFASPSRFCSASTAPSAPARAARASATPSISTWTCVIPDRGLSLDEARSIPGPSRSTAPGWAIPQNRAKGVRLRCPFAT